MDRLNRQRRWLAVVVSAAVLAVACGDDDGGARSLDLGGYLSDRASTTTTVVDEEDPAADDPGEGGSDEPASTIEWTTLGSMHRATLEVPLDHDDPGAGTIELALARRPASDPDQRIGVLLVNPGGPGGSGLEMAALFGFLFSSEIRARFDLIGWDPRGVGESTRVRCGDGEFMDRYTALDPVPQTPDAGEEAAALAREFAELCDRDSADLLPHIHTEASARDMDVIRRALGEDQISYLGFSYGTLLGSSYAELFPDRVRAFVLDGAYPRSLDMAEISSGQAQGFEQALGTFFEWCRSTSCAFDDGGDLGLVFDETLGALRADPAPTSDPDGRELTVGLAWTGVLAAMYTPQLWGQLAQGLSEARTAERGDGLLRLADYYNERLADGSYSSLHYAFTAYSCMDNPMPSAAEEQEIIRRTLDAAPRVGPVFVSAPSPCEHWPVPPVGSTDPFSIPDAPPMLVIATTGDPATPYEWGVELADQLASAVLLTVEGEGHTAFAGGNACVDGIVESYFIDLTVPAEPARCAT